ncbi:MAG: hypothetical protein M3552_22195 [Planctomycetota bacterium]|nr:hypothetical protein [Planctomycetota bacterium]
MSGLSVGYAFLALATLGQTAASDPGEPAVLERIVADWQSRQSRLDAVEYRLEGKATVPAGAMNGEKELYLNPPESLPPDDYEYPKAIRLVVDFAGNRARIEIDRHEFGGPAPEFFPTHRTRVFDGREFWDYTPLDRNPALQKFQMPVEMQPLKPEFAGLFFDRPEQLLMMAHGIPFGPGAYTPPLRLRAKIDPAKYRVMDSVTDDDGRVCTVLRIAISDSSYREFWVDPERQSAVVRLLNYSKDILNEDSRIEYRQTEHGWLPQALSHDRYSRADGELRHSEELRVVELIANPPLSDDLFRLQPPAGTVVMQTDDEAVVLQKGDQPARKALEVLRERQSKPDGKGWGLGAVFFGVAAAVLAVAAVIWVRRRA